METPLIFVVIVLRISQCLQNHFHAPLASLAFLSGYRFHTALQHSSAREVLFRQSGLHQLLLGFEVSQDGGDRKQEVRVSVLDHRQETLATNKFGAFS
jgi:hypothetical protein